jgi:hypothetical protein
MTKLHRQISSHYRRDKRPAWHAFKPRDGEHLQLSVNCGEQVSAEQAYVAYVARTNPKGKNLQSDGVMSVLRAECAEISRPVKADPQPTDPSHTLIGFTDLDDAGVLDAAINLSNYARARGWEYQPSTQAA